MVEAEDDVRGFVASTLRDAGWDVSVCASERPTERELEHVDAIVSDLSAAVRNGWLGPGSHRPPAKLIVSSPVSSFLEDVREQVDAVLETPTTRASVLAAVDDARSSPLSTDLTVDRVSRQQWLNERGLRAARSDPELTAIAALAARATSAPVGLVTLVDAQQQIFLGHTGLPPDLEAACGTPRAWSFCQHAVNSDAPLVIEDARLHPTLSMNPLVKMGLALSYAGVPVELPEVGPVGTVCVMSGEARTFDDAELASLHLAARLAGERLEKIARAHPIRVVGSPEPPPALRPGDVIDGKYLVTSALGEGGQAKVYLARDRLLGQLVAIKIQLAGADPSILHEARALAQLRHRSIVQLHGWGRLPSGVIYLVLEYVEGITLHAHLAATTRRRQPMSVGQALETTHAIGGALATLHAIGLLHGDVKPANIMLDLALDRAILIDFGLGVRIDGVAPMRGGTAGYSAPEQFDLDHFPIAAPSLDAYSLACVAYAMLAGHAPFEGTHTEQLAAQRRGALRSLSTARSELPPAFDEVFACALSGDPAQRYPSPQAFANALDAANESRPSFLPRTSWTPLSESAVPRSRGVVFRAVRRSLQLLVGAEQEAAIYDAMPADARAVFARVASDDELYPSSAYVDYVQTFVGEDSKRLEGLAGLVAKAIAHDALAHMNVSRTPETLLHVTADLVHYYHEWGDVRVRRIGSHAAELELTTPASLSPAMCRFFGAVVASSVRAMGRHASVVQTACVAEGSSSCRFDVRWSSR